MNRRVARTGFAALATALIAAVALPATTIATARAATGTPRVNPPALWYKIAGDITDQQAVDAASRYRVVILQSWQKTAAARIKSLNPAVIVLAYKDLSAADNDADALYNERNGRPMATGVGYLEAESKGWLAKATDGTYVNWKGYPDLWQLEVWNPDYQDRWVEAVTSELEGGVFDGVFGDDALTTLRYYSTKTLAEAPTDADLAAGVGQLISKASNALHAQGQKLVVNIAAAADNLATWRSWSTTADGAMLEHFAHWGSDPDSPSNYLWDWGSSGWQAGVTALGTSPLNVAVTTSADTDDRSYRYGLSSFLIATGGHGAFTAVDSYKKAPFRPEQAWDLGYATAARVKTGPIYSRVFPKGFAAVNPSKDQTATIPVPAGLVDVAGNPVSKLTLGPLSGAVLRATTTVSPTPNGNGKKWRHYAPAPAAPAPAKPAVTAAAAPAKPAAKPVVTKVAPAARPRVAPRAVAPAAPVARKASPAKPAPRRVPRELAAWVMASAAEPRRTEALLVAPRPAADRLAAPAAATGAGPAGAFAAQLLFFMVVAAAWRANAAQPVALKATRRTPTTD